MVDEHATMLFSIRIKCAGTIHKVEQWTIFVHTCNIAPAFKINNPFHSLSMIRR